MRGLLGDATEEFIESLDSTTGKCYVVGLFLKITVRFFPLVYLMFLICNWCFVSLQTKRRMMRRYIRWLE